MMNIDEHTDVKIEITNFSIYSKTKTLSFCSKDCNIYSTGATEPDVEGCAFSHQIFWQQVKEIMALRALNLGHK